MSDCSLRAFARLIAAHLRSAFNLKPLDPEVHIARRTQLSIIVVDRNKDIVDLLKSVCQIDGHYVRSATSAYAALALARTVPADVIFTAIDLPDCNGHQLAAKMRSSASTVTCTLVAFTGHGRDSDISVGKAVGFDYYLIKPVMVEEILATLGAIAARKGARTDEDVAQPLDPRHIEKKSHS